jgi:hypothetical protein
MNFVFFLFSDATSNLIFLSLFSSNPSWSREFHRRLMMIPRWNCEGEAWWWWFLGISESFFLFFVNSNCFCEIEKKFDVSVMLLIRLGFEFGEDWRILNGFMVDCVSGNSVRVWGWWSCSSCSWILWVFDLWFWREKLRKCLCELAWSEWICVILTDEVAFYRLPLVNAGPIE